ncbi:MAG: RNA-binding protein [Deltaproteobacteria bacterium]|nr:MAG: RNA-binding protein [Deltaproteobacteria bacterium]
MCQSTVYLRKEDGTQEEVLAEVASIIPEGGKLRLISLFGEEKVIDAQIEEIDLLEHKIMVRPLR